MAIIKCKMCGGDLNYVEGSSIAECEYCGTLQTIPKADDEKKLTLFARAGRLRAACEFDKAAGIYESIVADFPEEAEAYWGLVLCAYGIEYVDDPATGKKIPTCHRTCTVSVMDDDNFDQAVENADAVAKNVYREEAKVIDRLQQSIIAVAEKEEPYDIFICYKETDDITKSRTEDSSLAQDIYTELIKEDYRVFFSRVTLRDKAGSEYEPYIYAALSSAKVMLAIGTKYDYYDAIWVKNEWSRYLQMMAKDNTKHLIPCYKGIDAYDMPKEFKNLQGLNMGELTFFKNLISNVERFASQKKTKSSEADTGINTANAETAALIKRMFIFLEDMDWQSALEYCERILDIDPECSRAYLGKLMVELKVSNEKEFSGLADPFDENSNYKKAIRFGDAKLRSTLEGYITAIKERNQKKVDEERIAREKVKERLYKVRQKLQAVKGTVCAGGSHTVGLRSDGKVVATGQNYYDRCNVSDWHDIAAISAGYGHTVGLRSDGSVVEVGDNDDRQCNVSDWRDIVAISAGYYHTVGLRSDGSVVAVGYNYHGECDVSDWRDIVAISATYGHTVGLCSDGRVVAVGDNKDGQCNVSDWTDIVAISAGNRHTVGLRSDGRVVAVGSNECGRCDVSNFKLFNDLDNLEEEKRLAREKRIKEERIAREKRIEEERIALEKKKEMERVAEQRRREGLCPYCGGTFKGLFTKKCSNCGKPKDY